jgi:hypothetical protein
MHNKVHILELHSPAPHLQRGIVGFALTGNLIESHEFGMMPNRLRPNWYKRGFRCRGAKFGGPCHHQDPALPLG